MLKNILARIRGYRPLSAALASAKPGGGEVTIIASGPVSRGEKILAELPGGKTISGLASWGRELACEGGSTKHLVCLANLDSQVAEEPANLLVRERQCPRQPHRQWVNFPRLKGRGAVTVDLSMGGCRVATDLSDQVGLVQPVSLDLSGYQVLTNARVVWSSNGESGLRFLNLHIQDETALARFLRIPVHSRSEEVESLWQRSRRALTFRVTQAAQGTLVLEFETENWLVKYVLENAEAKGDYAGVFSRVAVAETSPQLLALRQQYRLRLDHSPSFVHLQLLSDKREPVLEIWGLEQSFSRESRVSAYQS